MTFSPHEDGDNVTFAQRAVRTAETSPGACQFPVLGRTLANMRKRVRIALAWAPFWAMWVLLCLSYPGQSLGSAALAATIAIGAAAVLGVAAWRLTGVVAWPEELGVRFYGAHLVTGSLFAALWVLAIVGAEALRTNHGLIQTFFDWRRVLGWYFLLGVSLYGLITFFSYTVRTGGKLREQQRLASEARLAALRQQLNPHFLFNALHSLSVLVRRNQGAAQEAIEQLGELLRYTLSDNADDVVPLAEEWRFTKTYLAIEQIRFGTRLVIEEGLAPDTMSCRVPTFALQILAENAVRHGIAPQPSGGTLMIRSRLDNGGSRLLLEVSDTGAGRGNGAPDPTAGGRGLKLLRERLVALYGPRGELVTTQSGGSNGGFTATISLPVSGS